MNIEEMERELAEFRKHIAYGEANLKTAESNNEKLLKYEEKVNESLSLLENIRAYKKKLELLLAVCNKKAESFMNERVSLLEQTVQDNLYYVFPEESFIVKLDLDITKAGRESCKLLLGKKTPNGIVFSPTTAQNGRFVRQLISVVVVYTLNYLRGSDMMYMDEALASSDKDNLTKLKPLLDRMTKGGMQTILIEHKSELYDDVSRRQFTLRKDRAKGVSVILGFEDIQEG